MNGPQCAGEGPDDAMSLPIALTLLRLALIPAMVCMFAQGTAWSNVVGLVILIAGIYTDNLDGRIARRRGLVSPLGGLLDPMADAFLFVALFGCFVAWGIMPLWMFVMVAFRELVMHTFMRPYMLANNVVMKAKMLGKLKTACQSGVGVGVVVFEIVLPILQHQLAPGVFARVAPIMRWTEWGALLLTALLSVGSLCPYVAEMARTRRQADSAPDLLLDAFLLARLLYAPALLALLYGPQGWRAACALAATVLFEVSHLGAWAWARRLAQRDALRRLLGPLARDVGRFGAVLVALWRADALDWRGAPMALALFCCHVMAAYARRLATADGAARAPRFSERAALVAQGLCVILLIAAPQALYSTLEGMCMASLVGVLDATWASRRAIGEMARPVPGQPRSLQG